MGRFGENQAITMTRTIMEQNDNLFGEDISLLESEKKATKKANVKKAEYEPPNLGKAVKLRGGVSDQAGRRRLLTCSVRHRMQLANRHFLRRS